jgi:hypothetical protein
MDVKHPWESLRWTSLASELRLLPIYLHTDIVDEAYRHYITRLGKPPGPMLAFAETEALRRGYRDIRLYTHQTMVENQRLYASIEYEETARGAEAGYDRVFMRKQLID